MKKIKFIIPAALFGLLLFVVIFAPYLAPADPYAQDLSIALEAPSAKHLLGTDRYGRDLLSRVIIGARNSVCSAMLLVVLATVFGSFVGMISGYYGGKLDVILMRISDIFLAFPGLVFAIAVAAVLGGGVSTAIFSLALISWPKFARIARSQVLKIKQENFILAAKLAGRNSAQIMIIHILPNCMGILLVTAMLDVGTMLMEIAGLSFLGLGAKAPSAEWGSMMSNGRSMILTAPWVVLAPGLAMFLTVAILNLFADALRDAL